MAKKRVHEIAKAQGMTSKELLAALEAAGVDAKAAQSSVEESDALAALKSSGDGASSGGAATKTEAPPAPDNASRQPQADGAPKPKGKPAGDGASAAKKGPAKRRRRVVIDSQAS